MPVHLQNVQMVNLIVMVMVQNVFMAHGNAMAGQTVITVLMKLTVLLQLVQIQHVDTT